LLLLVLHLLQGVIFLDHTSFVDDFLMPLEPALLERESRGDKMRLTDEEAVPLKEKCRELGLWGLDVPENVRALQKY
jgi:hypothetical protein